MGVHNVRSIVAHISLRKKVLTLDGLIVALLFLLEEFPEVNQILFMERCNILCLSESVLTW